jgi:CheY-like chemotaxis protein
MKGVGGRVEASNAAGGGGMVSLYFPPAPEPSAAPRTPEPIFAPSDSQGGSGVLLVDDNDAVRATTAAFLRECGLSVVEAPDAAQALKILETTPIEAVMSDIIMPGEMDGIGLAQAIKARWPAVPVLLVSGYSERAADAQSRGFSVLNKPYSLPEVELRLKSVVKISPTEA